MEKYTFEYLVEMVNRKRDERKVVIKEKLEELKRKFDIMADNGISVGIYYVDYDGDDIDRINNIKDSDYYLDDKKIQDILSKPMSKNRFNRLIEGIEYIEHDIIQELKEEAEIED